MAKCNCVGDSCGCLIQGGAGTAVTGVGSTSNPYIINIDLEGIPLGDSVTVSDSTTMDFTTTGDGTPASPLVISGRVLITAPNGTKWTLAVSNAGVLSAVAAV